MASLTPFLMMFQFPGARNQFGEYNSIIKDMNHGQKYKIKISAVWKPTLSTFTLNL